ncbi:MAG: hypothetical protein AAGA17_00105 [Actinomycetota bacterium]
MSTSVAAKNAAVDAVTGLITHLDLLDDSDTSVASARVAVEWDAAASRIGDNTNAEDITVTAGGTVFWVAGYTALSGGTQHSKTPAGSTFKRPALVENTGDLITLPAHGLSDNDRVIVEEHNGEGLPTGLAAETFYYVVSATTDTFQVSLTEGGAAVTISADGVVYVQDAIPNPFPSGGTYQIAAGALDFLAA